MVSSKLALRLDLPNAGTSRIVLLMKKNTNRRVQNPKPGRNEPLMRAMQQKRFGNAAGSTKPKTDYTRKGKYGHNFSDED